MVQKYMRLSFIVFAMLAAAGTATGAAELRQRAVSTTGLLDDHVIVGRAQCARSTWVLTDAPALARITVAARAVAVTAVRGLGKGERPWGLACLHDDSLWTLSDYRSLTQLSFGGEVLARVKLRQPRLGIFGLGEWLLLQQPAMTSGMALLSIVGLADISRATPWPGVTAPSSAAAKGDLSSGFVACGLPYDGSLPCWLANQSRITISDGSVSHTSFVAPRFIASAAVDLSVPIWDVALAARSRAWVLTSAVPGPEGRRVGARLTRSNARGEDDGHVDLTPRARLIVGASEGMAVVLTVTGSLVEVSER
jgi:hypothetical protein